MARNAKKKLNILKTEMLIIKDIFKKDLDGRTEAIKEREDFEKNLSALFALKNTIELIEYCYAKYKNSNKVSKLVMDIEEFAAFNKALSVTSTSNYLNSKERDIICCLTELVQSLF